MGCLEKQRWLRLAKHSLLLIFVCAVVIAALVSCGPPPAPRAPASHDVVIEPALRSFFTDAQPLFELFPGESRSIEVEVDGQPASQAAVPPEAYNWIAVWGEWLKEGYEPEYKAPSTIEKDVV